MSEETVMRPGKKYVPIGIILVYLDVQHLNGFLLQVQQEMT